MRHRTIAHFSMRGWSAHGLQVNVGVVLVGLSLRLAYRRPLARSLLLLGLLLSRFLPGALRGGAESVYCSSSGSSAVLWIGCDGLVSAGSSLFYRIAGGLASEFFHPCWDIVLVLRARVRDDSASLIDCHCWSSFGERTCVTCVLTQGGQHTSCGIALAIPTVRVDCYW